MTDHDATVLLRRRTIIGVLLMVDAMFLVLHLLSQSVHLDGRTILPGHDFINLDAEISFPTWWQQTQLVAAGALCLLLSSVRRQSGAGGHRHWFALGCILLYLSVDEGTQLHEGLIDPMQTAFDISGGPLLFAWVIPGTVAVVAFGTVFFRFWRSLPSGPRVLISAGGAAYLMGALGFEMLSGVYKTEAGLDRGYSLVIAAEESLEMVGISVFLFGALSMLRLSQPRRGVVLRVEDG